MTEELKDSNTTPEWLAGLAGSFPGALVGLAASVLIIMAAPVNWDHAIGLAPVVFLFIILCGGIGAVLGAGIGIILAKKRG